MPKRSVKLDAIYGEASALPLMREPQIAQEALCAYTNFSWTPAPLTPFANVSAVAAGSTLTWQGSNDEQAARCRRRLCIARSFYRRLLKRRILLSPHTGEVTDSLANTGLLPNEIEWLKQGFVVELAAVRPQKLLQMVALGIAKSRDPKAKDTFMVLDDGSHGLHVYSSDSFG